MRDGLSRRLAGLILVLAPLVFGGASAAADEPKTVRLLTVGNSFSQNATKYLDDLVKGSGDVLIHHQAAIGGGSLEQHWEKYERHEADPDDPRGLYTTKKSLVEELAAEPWDFVTIQQVSIKSHDASTYRPFAGRLADLIRGRSPHAKLYMHETWAYRRDDPRFAVKSPAPGEPADQEAMHRGLSHAYRLIAGEIGAPIIPVGDAFHLADSDPEWGYRPDPKFDFDDAAFPAAQADAFAAHGMEVVEETRRPVRAGLRRPPRQRRRPVPRRLRLLRDALREVGRRQSVPPQRNQRRLRPVSSGIGPSRGRRIAGLQRQNQGPGRGRAPRPRPETLS